MNILITQHTHGQTFHKFESRYPYVVYIVVSLCITGTSKRYSKVMTQSLILHKLPTPHGHIKAHYNILHSLTHILFRALIW